MVGSTLQLCQTQAAILVTSCVLLRIPNTSVHWQLTAVGVGMPIASYFCDLCLTLEVLRFE
jgi:hypothetical protein